MDAPATAPATATSHSNDSHVQEAETSAMFESPAVRLQSVADKSSMLMPGGTIGMKHHSTHGYMPVPDYLGRNLETMQRFHDEEGERQIQQMSRCSSSEPPSLGQVDALPTLERAQDYPSDAHMEEMQQMHWLTMPRSMYGKRIRYAIKEYSPLLDSSNITMKDWIEIAADVEHFYEHFDAFIILHGTDTMAYTASALSFLLENLGKTVILTGSQVPISEVRNDGVENLLGALTMAGHYVIPEVCLYFNNCMYRGNRASKVNAVDFDAFDSPNFRPLARVGINIDVAWVEVLRPNVIARFNAHKSMNPNVATLRLFPGITEATVRTFLTPPIQGVVLETYGAGNAPNNRPDIMQALKEATARGVVIVNCSQCTRGLVSDIYATSRPLLDAGVIPGSDMTPECALAKLTYLLSKYTPEQCRALVRRNLRGELTVTQTKQRFSLHYRNRAIVRAVLAATRPGSDVASEWCEVDEVERVEAEQTLIPLLLCSAAAAGDLEGMRAMEEAFGGSLQLNCVDYDGRTPLHMACSNGHADIVKYMLLHGASVHVLDRFGHTPLFDAVQFKRQRVAALLRQAGAHFNERELSEVVLRLHSAAVVGDLAKVQTIAEAGMDLDHPGIGGRTALHLAAAEAQDHIVDYLLENGADPHITDHHGVTPLEEAQRMLDRHGENAKNTQQRIELAMQQSPKQQ